MKHTQKNKTPFNDSIQLMHNEFPEDFHEVAELPGKYEEEAKKDVNQDGNIAEEMDICSIVNLDGDWFSPKMVFSGQYQSTPVDEPKLMQMGQYEIQMIYEYNLPPILAILTNIPKEKHLQELEITCGTILKPVYLVYDEENIEKRLNRAKAIINNNENLSNVDALNLGMIAVFAPRDKAQEIIEEVIKLYARVSQQLSKLMELTLYSVLFQMIDAYSKQEEDYQRLLKMLDDNTDEETKEFSKTMRELKEKYNAREEDYAAVVKENQTLKQQINSLKEEITILNHGPVNGK